MREVALYVVAFELFFQPAHLEAVLARASAALLFGASAFIAVDLLLQRYAGAGAVGLALVAAVTLDGAPRTSPRRRACRERFVCAPCLDRGLEPAGGHERRLLVAYALTTLD